MTGQLEGWNLTEEERKMLNHAEWQEHVERIRYRQTRQGAFEAGILSLDRSEPGQGLYRKCSDHGDGAEKIRAAAWGDEPPPRWRKLMRKFRRRLPRSKREIFDALLIDYRSRPAARIAGTSQPRVDRFKKFLKRHLAQCLQAYKQDLE